MAIALGGSITDPHYIALQIIFIQSAFFLTLGVALVLYDQEGGAALPALGAPKVLSMPFFFGLRDGIDDKLVAAAYMFHGAMFGVIAGAVVDRRSWCLDVIGTAFAVYVGCCFVATGWPSGALFWASLLGDAIVAVFVAHYVAGRREMQDIVLGGWAPAPVPPAQHHDVTASVMKRRATDAAV
jgi:hypothetical protein